MNFIPIHRRNLPWPAEIFPHALLISIFAQYYRPELFVELGVGNGDATRVYAPYCKKIYGVDLNRNTTDIPNLKMHKMSTREFKKEVLDHLTEPIEMGFIDACHESKTAFQDFEDLYPHLIENGIIFMHDTFPCEQKWTSPVFCDDSWRVPYMIKEKYGNVCEVLTIPIQPGLTMIKKYTKQLEYMNWDIEKGSEIVRSRCLDK